MKLLTLIRIGLGLLLLVSGALKVLDSQAFAALISSYGLSYGGILAPLISGLEVLLGCCLIIGWHSQLASYLTALMVSLFTLAFAYAYFVKGIEECGCMGTFLQLPAWLSFLRNILMIIGGFWLGLHASDKHTAVGWKPWAVIAATGIASVVAGATLSSPAFDPDEITIGDPISSTFLRYYHDQLNGEYSFVFVFSGSCPHCWNATPNMKSISDENLGNIIGLTFPNENLKEYVEAFKPNFPIFRYPTNEIYEKVHRVPLLIVIKDGRVEKVLDAHDIPSGPLLAKVIN